MGPLVATAIHDGHEIRHEVFGSIKVNEAIRLQEEDPYTGLWAELAPTSVVGTRSRFEVDLNRPREKAVYLTPEDAWGIEIWKAAPPSEVISRSLRQYDDFYTSLFELYSDLESRFGKFIVFDLHSYNHRRAGVDQPEADPVDNPQVNVGTGTMLDRQRRAAVVDRFISELESFDFLGGTLDVRENVRFRGGHCARWTHETFPDAACVLSIEVKKFFMDEWTGKVDVRLHSEIGKALVSTIPGILEEIG
jgi:N-formylglutamate amidohydrolase